MKKIKKMKPIKGTIVQYPGYGHKDFGPVFATRNHEKIRRDLRKDVRADYGDPEDSEDRISMLDEINECNFWDITIYFLE